MPVLGSGGETYNPTTGRLYTPYSTPSYEYYKPAATVAKKTTYTAPKVTAKVSSTPVSSAGIQTVAAPQAAPTIDDLIKKYYDTASVDVNSLYDKQKESQMQALKAQRDAAIGKINLQQGQTKQEYYDKRNQADVINAQNVQKLRELMAANGISASGENLTLNAKANSDRLNALNGLNQQEQAKNNEYAAQIADWNNPARDQAITNQIESARAQALLNAKQQAFQKAWNDYQYNNLSAQQAAQLAMSRYGIDAQNAATLASGQAALDYYSGFNSGQGGGDFQSNLNQAIQRGVPSSWAGALSELVRRESGYNPNAKNPKSTAYGYGQFLDSTRANYEKKMGLSYSNPVNQLIMMAQYVKDRYGSPQAALAFWDKNHYY